MPGPNGARHFLVPATGIDLHFSFLWKEKLWSGRRPAGGQRQSTGLSHLDGFESGQHQRKQHPFWVLFSLVPATGIEPVRILLRGILSPLCLPIPPCRLGLPRHSSIFLSYRQEKILLRPPHTSGRSPRLPPIHRAQPSVPSDTPGAALGSPCQGSWQKSLIFD